MMYNNTIFLPLPRCLCMKNHFLFSTTLSEKKKKITGINDFKPRLKNNGAKFVFSNVFEMDGKEMFNPCLLRRSAFYEYIWYSHKC